MRTRIGRTIATAAAVALLVAGCGDDGGDDAAPSEEPTQESDSDATDDGATGAADPGDSGGSGGGRGTVVLDGEAIELATVRCFLESQPAAAGGGNILFVVQGEGANADGEPVMVDISRYDDESMFAADVVDLYIGDVTTGEAIEISASVPTGTVTLEGSNVRADDLAAEDFEALTEHTVSVEIDC